MIRHPVQYVSESSLQPPCIDFSLRYWDKIRLGLTLCLTPIHLPLFLQASNFNSRQARDDSEDSVVMENEEVAESADPVEPSEEPEVLNEAEEESLLEGILDSIVDDALEGQLGDALDDILQDDDDEEEEVVVESSIPTVTVTATRTVTSTGPVQTLR